MKTWKRISVGAVVVLLLGIFSCEDPNAAGSEFTVTISGRVENRAQSGQDSVVITLNKPFRRDTTKSDGSFSYSFVSSEKNAVDATLSFRHMNLSFRDTSIDIQYSSTSKSVALGVVQLTGVTPGVDSTITGRPSLRAGVIILKSVSFSTISIRGAGSNDASILTFEVKDSLGVPVDDLNKTTVFFTLVNKPDLLTELNKTSAVTNSVGQASVQLTAGNRSGLAQVQAYALVKRASDTTQTDTIKSPIISLTIAGGLPVASRFTIGSQKYNVPGLVKFNLRNTITAVVGDTFGNPVQKGTVVYFSTTGGIIQPTATTSEDGTVGIDLITGNPIPANGIAVITAQVGTTGGGGVNSKPGFELNAKAKTVDDGIIVKGLRSKRQSAKQTRVDQHSTKHIAVDNQTTSSSSSVFTRTLNILFSGTPRITSNDSVFVVPTLGSKQINFTVADENGNPLSQGTTIKVTGIGTDTSGAVLSGDLDKNLPDTYDRSWTQFSINVADRRTKNLSATVPINISIEVTGENGNVKKTFQGVLVSSASGDSGQVSRINLINTALDSIVVAGAGSPNFVNIQARVIGATGQPTPNIPVTFQIVRGINGGEYLSNLLAVTNSSGIATTSLYSGVKSGLVQVAASVSKDTSTISSETKNIYIRTGNAASLSLISQSATSLTVKGGGNETATLVFEAKDSLGNAIDGSNQATVNFVLQGDTVGARINPISTKTDPNNGRATASISSGIQVGILQISAQIGSIKSAPVQIGVTGGLPSQSQFTVTTTKKNYSSLTEKTLPVTVTAGDQYGNPVKPGTQISFTTNGGIIDASSVTNSSGVATSTLQIVNPQPPSGIATIEAKTFGDGGALVRDTVAVVFSKDAVITEINGPYANFEIEDGLSRTFQFRVADINNNPLAAGNTITVSASGLASSTIVLSGDINVVLPDSRISGVGTTQFSFTARDTLKDEGQGPKPLSFTIKVNGPNTIGTLQHSFDGTLKGGSGAGNEGNVASVSYVSSTKDTIFVANAGIPVTDTITFIVKNIFEQPVSNAAVQFFFTQPMNASEYLSPSYAISDTTGKVKVAVHSGIKAGVLPVIAKVTAGQSSVQSNPVNVYIKTGPLSSIALISVNKNELSVRGVGGDENSIITFEGRDLLGNPLDFANQTKIYFSLVPTPADSEQIKPDSALTDPFNGRVTTTLQSGVRSKVIQVVAQKGVIKSQPVPIVIHGGFAVASRIKFFGLPKNISIYRDTEIPIKVVLGDKYGNPVKKGTAVYFGTDADFPGIITAASFTNDLGEVFATLKVFPSDDTSKLGLSYIRARTVGESGDVSDSVGFILTGRPIIPLVNVPTDSITLFDGTSTTVNYKIQDALGNPISGGHQYQVLLEGSVASQLSVQGDISGNILDTDDKINGTNFSFVLSDVMANAGTGGDFKVKIQVTGTTGTTIKTINGKLLAPANIIVPPTARQAASIRLVSVSANDISITGVGGTENSTITYEVLDSVGQPITSDNRATVRFKANFHPNGFVPGGTSPTILPTVDSTDENGRTRVSVTSGTQAGAVQIEASINLTNPVRTIKSQPVTISVNSGFADQAHFTIAPDRYNFPGLQKAFYSMPITIQAGDKHSNPVKTGTVIYFNTANGIIQTRQGLTNDNGFVTMSLYSGNPYPLAPNLASGLANGFSRVYASTIGKDSTIIKDSVEILWSGSPVITKTGGPATFTIANAGSAGPFTFTVADYLGHPMSQGTTIAVEGSGLKISGDANITMPDTKSSGAGLTSFTISIEDSDPNDTDAPLVSILTVNVSHPVYGVYKLILATGTVD